MACCICECRPCYLEISGTGLQTTSEKMWLWTSDWTGKACPLIVAFATMWYLYFHCVNTAIIETTTTAHTHSVTRAPSAIPIVEQIVLCKHKVTQSTMLLLPICHPNKSIPLTNMSKGHSCRTYLINEHLYLSCPFWLLNRTCRQQSIRWIPGGGRLHYQLVCTNTTALWVTQMWHLRWSWSWVLNFSCH